MSANADVYFTNGCGRCPLGGTPQCKVHSWTKELEKLRSIVLETELTEQIKWGVPTYTFQDSNVLILAAFNDNCTLSFLKGALLLDESGILIKPGENTQAGRIIRFSNIKEVVELEEIVKSYIYEAIEVERAGLNVEYNPRPEPIPDELQQKMDELPDLKTAFFALTPGRQRGYIIHFSQPKQSATRTSRIEKCTQQIINGVGYHDEYKAKGKK